MEQNVQAKTRRSLKEKGCVSSAGCIDHERPYVADPPTSRLRLKTSGEWEAPPTSVGASQRLTSGPETVSSSCHDPHNLLASGMATAIIPTAVATPILGPQTADLVGAHETPVILKGSVCLAMLGKTSGETKVITLNIRFKKVLETSFGGPSTDAKCRKGLTQVMSFKRLMHGSSSEEGP